MDTREKDLYKLLGKPVHIEVDRPIGYRHKNTVYPINYGFIPGMIAGDGEEQDVYILGCDKPITAFDGWIIGAVRRKNDWEDKLVAAPDGVVFHQGQIAAAVHFQEQYFDSTIISLFRRSCGVLPYRTVNAHREYLIVYEHFSQCWSLPKGHMEAGETEPETALRELFEETGLTAQLDTEKCAVIEYPLSHAVRKEVVFFPGAVNGTPKPMDGEIEKYKWVKAEELQDHLFPDTVSALLPLIEE